MTQWYYVIDGEQAGPVEDMTFRKWIFEGRIAPDQLVWQEGMPEWQAAATVPGLMDLPMPPPHPIDLEERLADPPAGGTNGHAGIGTILGQGGRVMVRNFMLLFMAMLIVAAIHSVPEILTRFVPLCSPSYHVVLSFFNLFWAVFIILPLTLGVYAFSLRLVCSQPTGVGNLFSGFHHFGKAIGLQLWMILLIMLWSLLFIIPGIIAALRYSQALYLITYKPSLRINESVKLSCQIMQGNKARLFGIWLVFILLSLVFLAPFWFEFMNHWPNTMQPGAPHDIVLSTPIWIWSLIAPVLLGMFTWPVLAEFHRDLTPPVVSNP